MSGNKGDELASLKKIREIVLSSKESGGGIRNFVKSRTSTTEISGDLPLSSTHKYW